MLCAARILRRLLSGVQLPLTTGRNNRRRQRSSEKGNDMKRFGIIAILLVGALDIRSLQCAKPGASG